MAKNARNNSITGELDYYFPLEITSPTIREYAKDNGLEIGMARLGFRWFEAVFVPCKITAHDRLGREIYLDTPSDVQYRIYKQLCRDELKAQDAQKQDGRCIIPDDKNGYKRCPCRVENPEYTPDNGHPKTIPVRCEGCKFERFRQDHTYTQLSALNHENDACDEEDYCIPTPHGYFEADRYMMIRDDFLSFVEKRNAKLAPLAELLTLEYRKIDAARKLGLPPTTVGDRTEKLKELLSDFLDNLII